MQSYPSFNVTRKAILLKIHRIIAMMQSYPSFNVTRKAVLLKIHGTYCYDAVISFIYGVARGGSPQNTLQ